MRLTREYKADLVKSLSESVSQAKASFLVDYKGMNVEQVTVLRKKLREVNAEMRVIRNTVARRALSEHQTVHQVLKDHLIGTNALIFAFEEASGPAKAILELIKETEHFKFKSGIMGNIPLDEGRLKELSTLPGKDELRGNLLGTLQAPMSQFVRVLNAVPGGFVNLLSAYKDQKEESQ